MSYGLTNIFKNHEVNIATTIIKTKNAKALLEYTKDKIEE